MSLGSLARKILGKNWFPAVGRAYRSIFVDLEKLARCLSNEIPQDAWVVDIGGGDGEPLNHLLVKRTDIRVTMIDPSSHIGDAISTNVRSRVTVLPATSVRGFIEMNPGNPECVIVSDVIHHIAPANRQQFLQDLHELSARSNAIVLIKDVEPGYFISWLGYLSDRYVTGDRSVRLISRAELRPMITNVFGEVTLRESNLFFEDAPNYLLCVRST